jgi:hypothetical protein
MLGSCLFWHNHHQMRSWLAWNFWTAFEKEHWQISNICVSLSNMVTLPWPRTVLWVLSHYGWEENGIILVQWKQCKLLSFGTRLWKLSEKRKKNWSCIWKISAELNLLWSWLQINDARIKRRHAWIMFGIVFGTLLGVSLILISRIDQHLACRKSSLAALCRSGSSVQRQTPLNFLVVGDWGRNGLYNQSLVAEQVTWGVCYMYHLNDEIFCLLCFLLCILHWVVCCTQQMGNVGAQLNVSFIISTGDNFYENGLTGPDDEQFSTSFSNIYTQKSLQTTWYSGNIVFPVGRCQRLEIYALWMFWIHAIDCRMSGHYFMLKWQTVLAEFGFQCWVIMIIMGM